MHYDFGFRFPFEWTGFVIPKTLYDELMGQFVIEELEIGKAGLATQFSKIVTDLVLQDTAKPTPSDDLPRKLPEVLTATKNVSWTRSSAILRSPHPQESVPVKAITMFLNPPLGISTGGDRGFRAFTLGESHLLAKLTNRGT